MRSSRRASSYAGSSRLIATSARRQPCHVWSTSTSARAGSRWERVHLLFRDYVGAHPAVAAEYEALKRKLAADHRDERIAYNDAKTPFIEAVIERAEAWAQVTDWKP